MTCRPAVFSYLLAQKTVLQGVLTAESAITTFLLLQSSWPDRQHVLQQASQSGGWRCRLIPCHAEPCSDSISS